MTIIAMLASFAAGVWVGFTYKDWIAEKFVGTK